MCMSINLSLGVPGDDIFHAGHGLLFRQPLLAGDNGARQPRCLSLDHALGRAGPDGRLAYAYTRRLPF